MNDLKIFFEKLYDDYPIEELEKELKKTPDDSYLNHHLIYWLIDKINEKKFLKTLDKQKILQYNNNVKRSDDHHKKSCREP